MLLNFDYDLRLNWIDWKSADSKETYHKKLIFKKQRKLNISDGMPFGCHGNITLKLQATKEN